MTARRGEVAPAGYDASEFPPFAVTVDMAVLTIRDGVLCVLLVARSEDPFAGSWALPGGFVGALEDVDDAAARELVEETGVSVFTGHVEQLRTYGAPGRDPRMRVVSVGFVAFAPDLPDARAGSDAAQAMWWPVDRALGLDLAFDHARILADALERVRGKLEYTTLAREFLPREFTLSELQGVFECVWGVSLDAGNFRRKVGATAGFVTAGLGTRMSGGRPAALFTAGPATLMHPPLLRPVPGLAPAPALELAPAPALEATSESAPASSLASASAGSAVAS